MEMGVEVAHLEAEHLEVVLHHHHQLQLALPRWAIQLRLQPPQLAVLELEQHQRATLEQHHREERYWRR